MELMFAGGAVEKASSEGFAGGLAGWLCPQRWAGWWEQGKRCGAQENRGTVEVGKYLVGSPWFTLNVNNILHLTVPPMFFYNDIVYSG